MFSHPWGLADAMLVAVELPLPIVRSLRYDFLTTGTPGTGSPVLIKTSSSRLRLATFRPTLFIALDINLANAWYWFAGLQKTQSPVIPGSWIVGITTVMQLQDLLAKIVALTIGYEETPAISL